MKKFKRMIALITVAMFLLSVAAPSAFAATKEDAFSRLNAVGVAYGDQNGDPMYDKSFTRAEAAAIMVNLSGMKAAIDAAKGATKFKDVPASHWASGVINLAVGAGIIKGYPDGTYKPDKAVTYAEMSAMLVQVLGYGPKLQGTWPANVIGKAAQLGLLDGVSVTDYNAAAVRSNVFLASDNSLDVAVLKEMKDGYEEGKTLMEEKLSVKKLAEQTVTDVPNTNLALAKNEATLSVDGTEKLLDSVDPNPYLGLKVVPWVKDDKIFFFDVKTSSSDIVTDKIEAFTDVDASGNITAGDTIKLDDSDKTYTLDAAPVVYKNYKATAVLADMAVDNEVKIVLNSGKAKYVIANSFTTKLVEKVNTSDEKITFEVSGSITLKDMVSTIVKGGKAITLADIKVGDVVDYVANTAGSDGAYYIVVTSGEKVEGKLTAAATDGKKVTIGGTEYKTNDNVYVSTDNGDSYGATVFDDGTDYTTHFDKNVTAFKNKDGKIAFMIASEGDASSYIPVLVKDIKRTSGGATEATYAYVAKFDGTETYYEVTKDTKLNGTKVTEADLKKTGRTAEIKTGVDAVVKGEVVKISLTADGKVDNIKEYNTDDVVNNMGAAAGFTSNKTAATITYGGVAYKVDANTKILKVKAYLDENAGNDPDTNIEYLQDVVNGVAPIYIDDVESLTWGAMENLGTVAAGRVGIIKDAGVAKYVVLFTKDTSTTTTYKYGMVITTGTNIDGTYWNMKVDGTDMSKQYDNGVAAVKGDLVKFKLNSSDEIDSAALVSATSVTVGAGTYDIYKIKSIDKTNKRIEVIAVSSSAGTTEVGSKFWIDVNDGTKYFDTEDTSAIKVLDIDTINTDDIVKLYDAVDKDGDDQGAGAFDSAELIYDFVVRINS